MTPNTDSTQHHDTKGKPASGTGYVDYVYRRRRTKTDWAGVGMADAFKSALDYFERLQAQRIFFRRAHDIQVTAARLAGDSDAAPQPVAKPQISPFYTSYPAALAAHAALGMTAYVEYDARVHEKALLAELAGYIEQAAARDHVEVDPAVYSKVVAMTAHCVQIRLLLEDMRRIPELLPVEVYRLFLAAQQTGRFASLPEILNAVILYGDVLPDWDREDLHPLTRELLDEVTAASAPFQRRLPKTPGPALLGLGSEWVHALCPRLVRFLPEPRPQPKTPEPQPNPRLPPGMQRRLAEASRPEHPVNMDEKVSPLAGPHPPVLFDPTSPAQQLASMLERADALARKGKLPASGQPGDPAAADAQEALAGIAKIFEQAAGQRAGWEDMRSDLVEQRLRVLPFEKGPIQGTATDGHQVLVDLGDAQSHGGDVFDRPLPLSENLVAAQKLVAEADPVTRALRRVLYPNVEQVPETERFRTSGALDPGRLALAGVSEAVYRRHRIHTRVDPKGRAVLLIACDGSASLDRSQMKMAKLLSTAWLISTARTDVQMLAGLYHSGQVRDRLEGPLVHWMYHPHKTPATSRRDAVRGLASLPESGTGCQSDALSLSFMVEEARRVAKGAMIYLICISDCAWNRSFNSSQSGKEEMLAFFRRLRETMADRLHVTLVTLGAKGKTDLEDHLDRVIHVPANELSNTATVAGRISLYVAGCIRERRRLEHQPEQAGPRRRRRAAAGRVAAPQEVSP